MFICKWFSWMKPGSVVGLGKSSMKSFKQSLQVSVFPTLTPYRNNLYLSVLSCKMTTSQKLKWKYKCFSCFYQVYPWLWSQHYCEKRWCEVAASASSFELSLLLFVYVGVIIVVRLAARPNSSEINLNISMCANYGNRNTTKLLVFYEYISNGLWAFAAANSFEVISVDFCAYFLRYLGQKLTDFYFSVLKCFGFADVRATLSVTLQKIVKQR